MYSPQVMTLARSMGDYLRFKPAIGTTLSELTVLVIAREWTQGDEWHVHAPIALKVGIKPATVEAIADGRRVSDANFAGAEKRFRKPGVVDLTAIAGYCTLLAMQLNMAQYGLPADGRKLERFPK
ncbi:hypothetical protein [Roseateles saccharophilus]|uniref:4-carboxymuconolactone decarboxylase n=1 Tax=Roseateles saccharophilus TaxID=304 RepID=A0A4R3V5Q1_ROSSA|nr:hypothetical protein [Roseateles saccharophilus]TCU98891.1 4-carboxymuconolactone decarboxylase [Roseateles saccharophilus]